MTKNNDASAPWVEPVTRTYRAAAASKYRQADDELMKPGTSRAHYCEILGKLSSSFGRRIDVLDAGCGTGRYFQCLRSVRRLVGVDLSEHMLEQARNPARAGHLDIDAIELRQGDALSLSITGKFDLIYSTGVLAEYAPLTPELLTRFSGLLGENGVLFFTAVDAHSRVHMPFGVEPSIGRKLMRKAFPLIPAFLKSAINRHLSPYFLTQVQLTKMLKDAGFADFAITPYAHPSGWQGTHLDCVVRKTRTSPLVTAPA